MFGDVKGGYGGRQGGSGDAYGRDRGSSFGSNRFVGAKESFESRGMSEATRGRSGGRRIDDFDEDL